MSWIEMTRNRVHWRDAMKTVMSILVSFFELLIPKYRARDMLVLWLGIPFQMLYMNR
jgi:hypothetical protein